MIEVGVDVPNATRDGDRAGGALRPGATAPACAGAWAAAREQSYCILVTEKLNDTAQRAHPHAGGFERRLLYRRDGPEAARAGRVLRHASSRACRRCTIGNILRDADILEIARSEAADFVAHPPVAEDLRTRVAYIRDHWQRRYGLVTV